MQNATKRNREFIGTTILSSLLRLGFVIAAILLPAAICSASATNVYLAQGSTGGGNGADCADALPVAWFNNGANWGGGAAQIGPGTIVHLCGTITGTANGNMLTVQGSGTSGNPITILFEPGAVLTAPYWGPVGAISLNGQSFGVIDGGTNGIIQNTQNGTGLPYQSVTRGIYGFGDNWEIRNITISNLYVHTSPADTAVDQTAVNCIYFGGSNINIHNNTMHDAGWCVFQLFSNGDGNVNIYSNQIYNIDHGWIIASGVAGGSSGPFSFHNNNVHDYENWDTTANAYHHDGIHCFTSNPTPAHLTGLNVYDNQFSTKTLMTAHIFLEGQTGVGTPCMDSTSNAAIHNNLFTAGAAAPDGLLALDSDGIVKVLNNTIIGGDVITPSPCFTSDDSTPGLTETFENNIISGCNTLLVMGNISSLTIDYNTYANGSGNSFVCRGTYYDPSQFSSWQSCVKGDSHSSYNANANLTTSTGIPNSGSPAISSGTNLTATCSTITALCSALNGLPRPTTGPWDEGAYQHGTSTPSTQAPNPPSELFAVVQ